MKQKVLLTGSTSFLGSKFVELYGDKFEIFGVARKDPNHPVDLLDFEAVRQTYLAFQPDIVIHVAADVGRDATTSGSITQTNPAITKNLVELAQENNAPFIFMSTEAVYGGKEQIGEYTETDSYQPRSPYGESKVASEKIVMSSGLPYLITRGHRFVGIYKTYDRPKQFPDILRALMAKQEVHLDSKKLFKPVLINNICDIFVHYIEHDLDKQIVMNIGVDKATTFYDFMVDVAKALGIDPNLAKPDGEETGWPQNSTLSLEKIKQSGYPTVSYDQMLAILKEENR
jgi:dTDP-4-dehydrorhamnose reductase